MGFQRAPDGQRAVARSGGDRSRCTDSGCMAKCRLVLHLRTRVLTVVIGVRAHFGVACWRTAFGRMDSGCLTLSRQHLGLCDSQEVVGPQQWSSPGGPTWRPEGAGAIAGLVGRGVYPREESVIGGSPVAGAPNCAASGKPTVVAGPG